jgi:hypothetical protein
MRLRKRTIVSVETKHLSVIRAPGSAIELWCEQCAGAVPMVTPEHAAQLCQAPPRAIYRRVERSEVHFVETVTGELLICCSSLPGATESLDGSSGCSAVKQGSDRKRISGGE